MTAPDLAAAARVYERLLREAARTAAELGIAAHPLVRDPDGYAKLPMFECGAAWLRFTSEDNDTHPWDQAAGLGWILGAPPLYLACVDIDDAGLADGIRRHYLSTAAPPRMQTTVRGGLHVFAYEPQPSVSVDIEVRWQERWAKVQLLGRQRQAAVCPTPGYVWVTEGAEPLYGTIGGLWHALAREMGLFYRRAEHHAYRARDWSRRLP